MNELDFSDKSVNYLPTRMAPAVKSSQIKSYKKPMTHSRTRFRDIEKKLEEQRLQNELREAYDF